MAHDQNWEKREFINFTTQFRIDVNNPQVGYNGSGVYDFYGNNDSGDVTLAGMTQGGYYRVYSDRTVEIIAGQKNDRGSVDICITGMKGSILITAMENGDVLVKGNNILLQAKKDITLKAGKNILIDAGSKIDLNAKEAYCDAPESNGPNRIPEAQGTSLASSFRGLKAFDLAVAALG